MANDQIGDIKDSQRIDKWLNITCLYKTRAKATKACEERRIKINNDVAKPAKVVTAGDEVTIKQPAGKFVNLKVLAISHKSLSAKEAKFLYEVEEIELSEEAKELMALYSQSVKIEKPKYKGRPTKKERRSIEKLKGGGSYD